MKRRSAPTVWIVTGDAAVGAVSRCTHWGECANYTNCTHWTPVSAVSAVSAVGEEAPGSCTDCHGRGREAVRLGC
jgi:hypothetical protein